jgi:hypothetical protein
LVEEEEMPAKKMTKKEDTTSSSSSSSSSSESWFGALMVSVVSYQVSAISQKKKEKKTGRHQLLTDN